MSVFFPKLSDGYQNSKLYQKNGSWQFGKIDVVVNFIIKKFATLKSLHFSQFFLVRGKSEKIESIHFVES